MRSQNQTYSRDHKFNKQWELEERMKLDNWHFVEYSKN